MNGLPTDAVGQVHRPAAPGFRIACLVPSITELLFDLGLGEALVARTGFCIHPADRVRAVPKVGGTKSVKLDALRAAAPTHVIVNIDENERDTVDAIRAFVPEVIVTHPLGPDDNFALYRLLGGIFGRETEAEALCTRLATALAALERHERQDRPMRRVLYAIWRDPWMTVSADTYIARMLTRAGWTVWAPPGAAGQRYPAFDWRPDMAGEVDLVLLSSEPYRFTQADADALAARTGLPVRLIDGEMVSWYGSRAIAGAAYLDTFADAFDEALIDAVSAGSADT